MSEQTKWTSRERCESCGIPKPPANDEPESLLCDACNDRLERMQEAAPEMAALLERGLGMTEDKENGWPDKELYETPEQWMSAVRALLARIKVAAHRIESGQTSGKLFDANGNSVGRFDMGDDND